MSCPFDKLLKCQLKRGRDSDDNGEPGIRTLALLYLRERLGRDMCTEGKFSASQAFLPAGVPQNHSHRTTQLLAFTIGTSGSSWHRHVVDSSK
jgi:hypothetical protein